MIKIFFVLSLLFLALPLAYASTYEEVSHFCNLPDESGKYSALAIFKNKTHYMDNSDCKLLLVEYVEMSELVPLFDDKLSALYIGIIGIISMVGIVFIIYYNKHKQ
jgi:hypothetical protein